MVTSTSAGTRARNPRSSTSGPRKLPARKVRDQAPYPYTATVRGASGLVFTAGACPPDRAGETVAVGDVAAQAERVMTNLVLALHAAGAELADVIKTTVYVASGERADLATVWEVVRRRMDGHHVPSTLLGVAVLGYPDQLVEVEAVAVLPPSAQTPDPAGPAGRRGPPRRPLVLIEGS
jgi:enamine deaminase RidA (YjgF/YER057c/UK114 family)